MAGTAFGPQGPNYTTVRPAFDPVVSGGVDTWSKNCSAAGAKDGTFWTADFINVFTANMRALCRDGNIPLDGTNDLMVTLAVQAIAQRIASQYAGGGGGGGGGVYTASQGAKVVGNDIRLDIPGLDTKVLSSADLLPFQSIVDGLPRKVAITDLAALVLAQGLLFTRATATGTNTMTGTLNPVVPGSVSNYVVALTVPLVNTGAASFNTIPIFDNAGGDALVGGELPLLALLYYDGVRYRLLNPVPPLSSGANTANFTTTSQSFANQVTTPLTLTGSSPSWATLNTNTFTVNKKGKYAIFSSAIVIVNNNSGTNSGSAYGGVRVNGSLDSNVGAYGPAPAGYNLPFLWARDLAVGDTFSLCATVGSNGGGSISAGQNLRIQRMG